MVGAGASADPCASAAATCRDPTTAQRPTTPSSSRRRGSIRTLTHHWIPACAGMTGYWCTVGWCRCARGCGHDMSLPCACPIPYHPVILAQARIPTYSDASLDSCLRRMTGYWCTAGWCRRRCKCRSVRECRRDMSRPYDCPTPYHPVILAQARIHTLSDASLDSCLRRNDGLLVHCWLVQAQVQIRARVPPQHVAPLRLPNALPPRHPRAGEDPYVL